MPDNEFLQFLNLFLAMQGIVAVIVFSRYLLDGWPRWYESRSYKMAIGFVFFFFGFTLFRFWFWFIRFAEEKGLYIPPQHNSFISKFRPVFMFGTIIMTWGLICVLREISVWKNSWGWVIVMLVIAGIAALLAWAV